MNRRQFKMSEIIQSQRPRIIEAVTTKFRHLQPFMKIRLHKAAYDAIESVLVVIRATEDETEKHLNAKNKNPQPQTTTSS